MRESIFSHARISSRDMVASAYVCCPRNVGASSFQIAYTCARRSCTEGGDKSSLEAVCTKLRFLVAVLYFLEHKFMKRPCTLNLHRSCAVRSRSWSALSRTHPHQPYDLTGLSRKASGFAPLEQALLQGPFRDCCPTVLARLYYVDNPAS